ncbi:MAG: hypothetical protein A3F72_14395 [Bacteroidetes bacterium RIFCSPLOWO2_12_FULL_35_15]|nr:MAG: hypothetical protein A3F72_14395 [Bacteroidetes bacterium RIFCSPLOWO2_12_FULL_35_15]
MKTIRITTGILFFIAIATLTTSLTSGPDCGSDAFLDKYAPALGEFTFIKAFNVEINKADEKNEFSYVFSKGSNYRIVICDPNPEGNKMVVNFYDRNKKLIASNYLKSSKKFFPTLNYTCSATGVYYVESYFENGKNGCGVNILGFK